MHKTTICIPNCTKTAALWRRPNDPVTSLISLVNPLFEKMGSSPDGGHCANAGGERMAGEEEGRAVMQLFRIDTDGETSLVLVIYTTVWVDFAEN